MSQRNNPDGLIRTGAKLGTLALAGSTQADGGAIDITKNLTTLTGADGTKGAVLPAVTSPRDLGSQITLHNSGTSTAKVYPESGGTINGAAANASVTLAATSFGVFIVTGAATWKAYEAPAA